MKKFKKISSLTLSILLVIEVLTSFSYHTLAVSNEIDNLSADFMTIRNEFVAEYPEDIELIDDVINQVVNDPQYEAAYAYDKESALSTLTDCLNGSINQKYGIKTLAWNYKSYFYSNYTVPVVKQSTKYYCGPASVIEALIGNGLMSNTAANKSKSKQDEIAKNMKVTEKDGVANVPTVVDELNANYSGSNPYGYGIFTKYNYSESISYMTYAFVHNMVPVVYIADTSKFDYYYYNDKGSFTHYVVVASIDYESETICIVDPHYDNRYGGIHYVSFDEFYDAMKTYKVVEEDQGVNCYIISYGNRKDQ